MITSNIAGRIGALELSGRISMGDDSALEVTGDQFAAGPTSMNAGCSNTVFTCPRPFIDGGVSGFSAAR